jgi:molybdate transport system ATP-binding protein
MTSPNARLSVAVAHTTGTFSLDAALDVGAEPVALIGPNGSGKTSFLLAILGLRRSDRGRITLGNEVLLDSTVGIDRAPEERHIAYLPQDFGLFPFLTAQENVEFAIACQSGRSRRVERRRAAKELLAGFGVSHLADRSPAHLSGGERQRVALARAIASQPQALLLDEPTASLDVEARTQVRALLSAHIRDLAIPTIIVTHDCGDVLALAGRVAVMEKGRITTCASLAETRRSPPTPFAARLLGPKADTIESSA